MYIEYFDMNLILNYEEAICIVYLVAKQSCSGKDYLIGPEIDTGLVGCTICKCAPWKFNASPWNYGDFGYLEPVPRYSMYAPTYIWDHVTNKCR